MKYFNSIITVILSMLLLHACSNEDDLLVDYPDDITFNELELDRFSHKIPENGFSSGGINFNTVKNTDGSYSGFAYSNRSNRSFTWDDTALALDSNIYSVYTPKPNQTGVYTVVHVKNDDAYFTLDKPTIIEHILIANTTYTYLGLYYGNQYGTTANPLANPNIPSAPKGVWYSYIPELARKMDQNGDYFKVIVNGYKDGILTGQQNAYLCCRKDADPAFPQYNFLRSDWVKADLTSLGVVDKVVFQMDCNLKNSSGESLIPTYFCIDGIRIKKN